MTLEYIRLTIAMCAVIYLIMGDSVSIVVYIAILISTAVCDMLSYLVKWYLEKEEADRINRSLAQAYVYRNQCQPFGIYKDDTMIGYVMVIYDYDIPEYDIWHMMIDESNQGQGYGSIALDLVIEYIKTKPFGASDKVTLTCNMDNIHALNLYRNKGFKETGAMDEDEIELSLML